MHKSKRILIISDVKSKPMKMFVDQTPKLAKGFIRLGHDIRIFSYSSLLSELSIFKSKRISEIFYKSRVDELLIKQIKNYQPDIVFINFPKALDVKTVTLIKYAAPEAVLIGEDGDPWPKLQKDNRIETAKKLDILIATNDGQFLQDYRDAGVPLCVFMPNMIDPDTDHWYEVGSEWEKDILWTGKTKHHADTSETLREELVLKLATLKNCAIYGGEGYPKIGGFDYLYAISGAKIGVNVNAINSIRFYHSDRLTHYLACGTFVLAKRVPDTDMLFKDGVHIKYFDTVDEFFELADWYLKHDEERKKIADAGMQRAHSEFNSVKIAGYILDLIEKGKYNASWI